MLQLSSAVTLPQFLPSREQKLAADSLKHPQTFDIPAPPQVWGAVQLPHDEMLRLAPQRSVAPMLPQFFPTAAQSSASDSPTQRPAGCKRNRWLLPLLQVHC